MDIEKTINDIKEYAELLDKYRELEKENKKLRTDLDKLYIDYDNLSNCNADLIQESKKLKETIKDHQFYEEKLEHRIIELEELLHGE